MSEWAPEGKSIPADARIKNRGIYGKYWDKTANVKTRRRGLVWLIPVSIILIVVGLLDAGGVLGDIEQLKLAIVGILVLLIIVAALLMVTRTNEYAEEEEHERVGLQTAVLQCPECQHVFEFKENHFTGAKKVAFTCPSCGMYGGMPDMHKRPVKRVIPEGDVREYVYECRSCREEIKIGIYGNDAARQSRFRNCPHCGARDTVETVYRPPPPPPEEEEEDRGYVPSQNA